MTIPKHYNILYKGRKIYRNLTIEECSEILENFADRNLSGEEIDPNEIELEEF